MSNDPVPPPDDAANSRASRDESRVRDQRPVNGDAGVNGPRLSPDLPWGVPIPVPPEVMEWARRNFSEEDFLADLRDVEENGGLELSDFIGELERMVRPDE
jgi:hypothetical protein